MGKIRLLIKSGTQARPCQWCLIGFPGCAYESVLADTSKILPLLLVQQLRKVQADAGGRQVS